MVIGVEGRRGRHMRRCMAAASPGAGPNDLSPLFPCTNRGGRACGRRHARQPGMPRTCIWYHGTLGLPAASPPCHIGRVVFAIEIRKRGDVCGAGPSSGGLGAYRSGGASAASKPLMIIPTGRGGASSAASDSAI
jgi:hypothetical protein